MKKLLLFAAVMCCTLTMFAKPPKGWTTDYDAALKTAAKEKKHVYVLFTGSDWCSWCIRLHNDVLSKKQFQKFANKHLILVYCDFPRQNKPSDEQLAKQMQWAKKLKIDGGVPSAVIVNSKGRIVGKIGGYLPLKQYMAKLENIVK